MHQHTCDLCHRDAIYHDTSIENGIVVQRHLCGIHGRKLVRDHITSLHPDRTLDHFKDLFSAQVDRRPDDWVPPEMTANELKTRIRKARNLKELAAAVRHGLSTFHLP